MSWKKKERDLGPGWRGILGGGGCATAVGNGLVMAWPDWWRMKGCTMMIVLFPRIGWGGWLLRVEEGRSSKLSVADRKHCQWCCCSAACRRASAALPLSLRAESAEFLDADSASTLTLRVVFLPSPLTPLSSLFPAIVILAMLGASGSVSPRVWIPKAPGSSPACAQCAQCKPVAQMLDGFPQPLTCLLLQPGRCYRGTSHVLWLTKAHGGLRARVLSNKPAHAQESDCASRRAAEGARHRTPHTRGSHASACVCRLLGFRLELGASARDSSRDGSPSSFLCLPACLFIRAHPGAGRRL